MKTLQHLQTIDDQEMVVRQTVTPSVGRRKWKIFTIKDKRYIVEKK